jgi:AraC-like DNA-binding protein
MKLYIKNMVSIRCKIIVRAELEKLGLHPTSVELGEANIVENISSQELEQLDAALQTTGLKLLEDKRSIIVEKIKNIIVEMIHYSENPPRVNFSEYLSEILNESYTTLSHLFSEMSGTTIEHYIIAHRIERAKELITYDELTLSEIAFKLHYSSVAHLSSQFKKTTGLTPSHFKMMKERRRIPLAFV